MKKIVLIIIIFLGLFYIYHLFDHHKINYVSIGDGLIQGKNSLGQLNYGYNDFIKDYLIKTNHLASFNNSYYSSKISDLTDDIKNNRTIWNGNNEFFVKKVLRESDVLVISIGMEELSHNYNKYNMESNIMMFEKIYNDVEKLIFEIKKYAHGIILFVGYYNPTIYYDSKADSFFCNLNIRLNRLMMTNRILYIDMYEIVKENHYKDNLDTPFLNTRGYARLAEIIKFYIK